ncbi:MAG: hypothetical protein U5N55_11975 [Cypionkella sp.]|nr:hypothetical protein [Cypionkella sp.]MDZ7906407.1 hypothetical protein [Cypionkella sp.]
MTSGALPPDLADLVSDAGTSEFVIGAVSYGIAEIGWLLSKRRSAA